MDRCPLAWKDAVVFWVWFLFLLPGLPVFVLTLWTNEEQQSWSWMDTMVQGLLLSFGPSGQVGVCETTAGL